MKYNRLTINLLAITLNFNPSIPSTIHLPIQTIFNSIVKHIFEKTPKSSRLIFI